MYTELAILALFVFLYSIFSGRFEQTIVSGPMIFVFSGLLMGPLVLNWLQGDVTSTQLRVLADLTLAIILFIDAANADFSVLKRQLNIPFRMLLFGLPGVIFLGTILATLFFTELTLLDAAILATMLAATDAALGKAVITNPRVPARVREGLNLESGLNDGLCVPILFVFIAFSLGQAESGGGYLLALKLVVQEIGIGLVVGLGLTWVGAWLIDLCYKRGWLTEIWMQITAVALAITCFASAQALHGSGYIAAFTGGLLFGFLAKKDTHQLVLAAEGIGETLALMTWMVFGVAVIGQAAPTFTWSMVIYAVLSLTVIRMVPIFFSLAGLGETTQSRLFLGWFGPRGLASIVFAIIVLNRGVPQGEFMAMVVTCTVFLSLLSHGISATPLAAWLGKKEQERKNI